MRRGSRTVLTLLLPALVALPAMAAAPKAVVEKPVVDVGVVKKGEPVSYDFVIRNAGDAPLEITEVKPSCGCTVADFDELIAPGASGKVSVVVETDAFGGGIAKSVTVFTNDANNPKLSLVVKANVREPVVARPGYARFVTVEGQAADASVQTVAAADGSPFEVLGVQSPYPFVKASHRREGDSWKVEVNLDHRSAPTGSMADYVLVRTNHPEQQVVKIAVSGLVRPIIQVAPAVANFGRRELAEPQSKSLEIKNLGGPDVEITEVTSDVVGLETELKAIEEGRHYRVKLTLTDTLPQGDFEGSLTIKTTSPRRPVVEVPLRGTIL